jgi:hypothetical protein
MSTTRHALTHASTHTRVIHNAALFTTPPPPPARHTLNNTYPGQRDLHHARNLLLHQRALSQSHLVRRAVQMKNRHWCRVIVKSGLKSQTICRLIHQYRRTTPHRQRVGLASASERLLSHHQLATHHHQHTQQERPRHRLFVHVSGVVILVPNPRAGTLFVLAQVEVVPRRKCGTISTDRLSVSSSSFTHL